jgi:hypothetical protein
MGMYGGNRLTRGVVGGGGGPAPVTGYDYGSPAGAGGTDGGGTVVAQYIFTEDLDVDTFADQSGNGITLTNNVTASVNQIKRLDFRDYSPLFVGGARLNWRDIYDFFGNTSPGTALYAGAGDFVIEWVGRFDNRPGVAYNYGPGPAGNTSCWPWDTRAANTSPGIALNITPAATGNVVVTVVANDGTSVTLTWTNPFAGAAPWQNSIGTTAKWRLVCDRTANTVEVFYNGTTLTSKSIAALGTKSIDCGRMTLWSRYDRSSGAMVGFTYGEWRMTVGTTTANSGGPNGG